MKSVVDVINWGGTDSASIIQRGLSITKYSNSVEYISEHARKYGLDTILEMGVYNHQVPSDTVRAIDCFDRDDPDLMENVLGLLDYELIRCEEVCYHQMAVNTNGTEETALADSYLKSMLEVCCSPELRHRIDQKFKALPHHYQGGVMYAYYFGICATNLSKNILDEMEKYFSEVISGQGLAKVKGEDVRIFSRLCKPNARFLELGGRDLSEVILHIVEGLAKCTCSSNFAAVYKSLAVDVQNENYQNIKGLRGIDLDRVTLLDVMDEVFEEATALFDKETNKGKWTTSKTSRHGAAYRIDAQPNSSVDPCDDPEKKYTKSGLEVKRYPKEEWTNFSSQQRSEIWKAHKDKGLRYTKEQVEAEKKKSKKGNKTKSSNSSTSTDKWTNVVIVKGKAYGICAHCGTTNHVTEQHNEAEKCRLAGTVYKPGKSSNLAKAINKYGEGPPLGTSTPAPPPPNAPTPTPTPNTPSGPATGHTFNIADVRRRLHNHETSSSNDFAAEQTLFFREMFPEVDLNC